MQIPTSANRIAPANIAAVVGPREDVSVAILGEKSFTVTILREDGSQEQVPAHAEEREDGCGIRILFERPVRVYDEDAVIGPDIWIVPEGWEIHSTSHVWQREETGMAAEPPLYGWVCPVCGRGLAIWLSVCPCYEERQRVVTSTTEEQAQEILRKARLSPDLLYQQPDAALDKELSVATTRPPAAEQRGKDPRCSDS